MDMVNMKKSRRLARACCPAGLEGAGIPPAPKNTKGRKGGPIRVSGRHRLVNSPVNSLKTLPDAHPMPTRCPPNDYRMTTE